MQCVDSTASFISQGAFIHLLNILTFESNKVKFGFMLRWMKSLTRYGQKLQNKHVSGTRYEVSLKLSAQVV